MTAKEAMRRLRAVGFTELRRGRHVIMEGPDPEGKKMRISLATGSQLGPGHTYGIMRILAGRPVSKDGRYAR